MNYQEILNQRAEQIWRQAADKIKASVEEETRKLGLVGSTTLIDALVNGKVCPEDVKELIAKDIISQIEISSPKKQEPSVDDDTDESKRERFLRDEIKKLTGNPPAGRASLKTLEKQYADLVALPE